ncbi:Acyl-CoA N-acyltransferase [Penicillium vulpinum]|uniref:N-acetyltransferase domain-containing protein n=1 Tax=Penicillium vulpinum TaxID=29845 RepID=A0A1V6RWJ9_9EURO|nr:Acyl-CoA N-acyltransferase [Penicillium vulpinum]KAJ5970106.1 Acyl-CoA N-acyltransferase [Penicillium vulpinum]OQE06135.1 hypothetical protein PENVUL_c019G04500 [Penicillium vulpinum]
MARKLEPSTSMQSPPGPQAKLVLPSQDTSTNTNPTIFNDAMIVRKASSSTSRTAPQTPRSTAMIPTAGTGYYKTPHAHLTAPPAAVAQGAPEYDWKHEPCIKLTRVAIMPSFRGLGLGRRLVEIALEWAAVHAADVDEAAAQIAARRESPVTPIPWRGLVLVHAQVDVVGMYAGFEFETDQSLGRWDEEGIEYVGMFQRVVLNK